MLVSADLQLLLFLPPQLQQEPGSRLAAVVPPAQDVRRRVGVVTQLEQGGEDDAVDASGARLFGGEIKCHPAATLRQETRYFSF